MGGAPAPEVEARAAAIEAEVLARVSPDPDTERRIAEVRGQLVERAAALAKERGIPLVRALVAGSAARGTYLKDRMDIDLFLLFPPATPRDALERQGLELAGLLLNRPETRYAEHPYLRGEVAGFQVDAVPGYAITDPSHPQSAVDRTPFHEAYLEARHTPETIPQVRLAKQFLRGLGVYGSESRTRGFSGYLVELLVLRFGSFRALLAEARGWRIPVRYVSTPGSDPTVPTDVALVLDDPVDPGRNVATALSRRNLALFVLAAGEYLERPHPRFFEVRPVAALPLALAVDRMTERGTHIAAVWLPRPSLVDDILYPQLRKAERALADEAARLGFSVLGTAGAAGPDRVVLLLEVEHGDVPVVRVQDGPPPGVDRVGSFLDKWTQAGAPLLQGPYVEEQGKLAVETRRRERRLEPLLAVAAERLPLGKDLKPRPGTTVTIRSLREEAEDETLDLALAELLGKRLPWLD